MYSQLYRNVEEIWMNGYYIQSTFYIYVQQYRNKVHEGADANHSKVFFKVEIIFFVFISLKLVLFSVHSLSELDHWSIPSFKFSIFKIHSEYFKLLQRRALFIGTWGTNTQTGSGHEINYGERRPIFEFKTNIISFILPLSWWQVE